MKPKTIHKIEKGSSSRPMIIKVNKNIDNQTGNTEKNPFSITDHEVSLEYSTDFIDYDIETDGKETKQHLKLSNLLAESSRPKSKGRNAQILSKDTQYVNKLYGRGETVVLDMNLIKERSKIQAKALEDGFEEMVVDNCKEDGDSEIVQENKKKSPEYFSDNCKIYFKAGDGGNGSVAYDKGGLMDQLKPDGGSGGKGGDIVLIADKTVQSFSFLRKRHYLGNRGVNGYNRGKDGKPGKNTFIHVPVGTILYEIFREKTMKKSDLSTDKEYKKKFITDLNEEGMKYIVVKGGVGGIGNKKSASKKRSYDPSVDKFGGYGQEKEVELILKCVADVCFVGFPNAGKSTLMSSMTRSMPKIAPYEFTTLFPHLGKLIYDDYKEIVIEDLPGIIENAHLNKGLGHRFLKHIERAKILLFLLDGSNNPEWKRNPNSDFNILRKELIEYDSKLEDKPYIVVLNKSDIADSTVFEQNKQLVKESLKGSNAYFIQISAKCGDNISELTELIRHLIEKIN
eukprot:CAMPEP_0170516852 /NCGR_PEP_ID=MMETSP0209-20121228/2979_1 /TAXON_ID=665100 ORGANISM="Litonotus pictus, Strain P1" /NCGR_SAMPLE_ID=MMETSP0209 /ASSEMBLY_ACC=CAM_ASM_000301 /LENGTH=510 /DNA_ID=CAMNT_0010801913 /DNA_START=404 /DNA_END=1936 /DNA_ORIENTATION=-